MKKLTWVAMAVVMASSSANAQMAGTKAGLWETKVVRQVIDGQDMTEKLAAAQAKMQAAMAQMTPEQRQKIAPMMKGMAGQGANGNMRICISPAMATSHSMSANPNNHCPSTSVTTNGNKTTYNFNCMKDGRTIVGTEQSTYSGDLVSSHLDAKSTDTKGSHTVVIDTEMTYLGSDCQGITPIDQLAKQAEATSK